MPSRNSVICWPSLQHDGVLADQVDAADVAVEIDPDAGPVEPRGDLLDMRRFARAVIALDHHAAVVGEAGQDRQRGVAVETVGLVEIRHIFVRLGEGRRPSSVESMPNAAFTSICVSGFSEGSRPCGSVVIELWSG